MRFLIVIAALAIALSGLSRAQTAVTFPATTNNTEICVWMTSSLQINGSAIGQVQLCSGVPDTTAEAMIGGLCPSPTACTGAALLSYMQTNVLSAAQNYVRQQAAQAAPTLTLTPLQ